MSRRSRKVAFRAVNPEQFSLIAVGADEDVAPLEVLVIEIVCVDCAGGVTKLVDDAVAPTAIERLAAIRACTGDEFVERLSARGWLR